MRCHDKRNNPGNDLKYIFKRLHSKSVVIILKFVFKPGNAVAKKLKYSDVRKQKGSDIQAVQTMHVFLF